MVVSWPWLSRHWIFTNNSAGDSGGVMCAIYYDITSSAFTNNNAAFGDVISIIWFVIIITSSNFTNNSSGDNGGVMDTSA